MSSLPTQSVGGLISGLDTNNIIEQYMAIERRPITLLENKKVEQQTKLEAYRAVNSMLLDYQAKINSLANTELWDTKKTSSTDESILTAIANEYAQVGSHTFRVGRLAQSAQYMSAGFADRESSPVSPFKTGTIRIDSSKSKVNNGTKVSLLNGGTGIYHGKFKITDRSGNSAVIDASIAETLDEIITAINNADGIEVTASINPATGDGLLLTDNSGASLTNFKIENYGGGTTATDLGIEQNVAASTITGDSIYTLAGTMGLNSLRDGLGVNDGTPGKITITDKYVASVTGATTLASLKDGQGVNSGTPGEIEVWDGTTNFIVDLSGTATLNDVAAQIAADTSGAVTATVGPGNNLILTRTAGAGILQVNSRGSNNTTAEDLGLTVGSTTSGTLDGEDLSLLKMEIDLSTATTAQDVVGLINNSSENTYLTASLSGRGFQISGGKGIGDLTISSSGSDTTAQDLGLAMSSATGTIDGYDLISDLNSVQIANLSGVNAFNGSLSLESLNGGSGIPAGTFTITDRDGDSFDVTLTGTESMSDLLSLINDNKVQITGTTNLADLGSGSGVNGGTPASIDIYDGSTTHTVDLSGAVTMDDVIAQIAADTGGAITAAIGSDNNLVLTRTAGEGLISVSSSGVGNTTAEDLGIKGSTTDGTYEGSSLAYVDNVDVQAYIDYETQSLVLVDNSSGGGSLTVTSNATSAALGIDGSSAEGKIVGTSVYHNGINGTRGDISLDLGQINISDDGGATWHAIDLSSLTGSDSLDDLLHTLNTEAAATFGAGNIEFKVNSQGNGIEVVNNTAGTTYTIENNVGTTASDLGLDRDFAAGENINAGDLDRNYLSRSTKLSTLNGGSGVYQGTIRITNGKGTNSEISLASAKTLGDVIDLLSGSGLNIKASINSTGDGLLILDQSGGGAEMKIEEVSGGSTAKDLGILGVNKGSIDGSFEKAINVDTDDTLTDILYKIQDSGAPVQTSIIYDGSEYNPYRLTVSSEKTGTASDFILDTDLSIFGFQQNTKGQDSVLLYGTPGSAASPILITSSTNNNNNAVLGLTLQLQKVSTEAVTINVTEDTEQVSTTIEEMVTSYNTLHDLVAQLDVYDEEEEAAGVLFGDTSVRNLMSSINEQFFNMVDGIGGGLSAFYDLGINFNDEGNLEIDSSTLTNLINNNFNAVRDLMVIKRDVARRDLNASINFNGSAAAGFDLTNLINGNDNNNDWGSSNGFESSDTIANGDNTMTITFDKAKSLTNLTLHHVDTDEHPASTSALRNFKIEYLDPSTNQWNTLREVKGNTSAATYVSFQSPTKVSQIRITATSTNAADGKFRLLEVEAEEEQGLANKMNAIVNAQADSIDGFFATNEESLQDRIDSIDDTIEGMEERMEQIELNYLRKFTAMETALATLNSQSDFFTQQMDALNRDK